jgi:hypothetical protein
VPFGRGAQTWVKHAVGELKRRDPLAPVTVIVPNYYAGRQLRWALAGADGARASHRGPWCSTS